MWRQVALPVIVVALSWFVVSGSTTFYLQWLDDSYQRVFDENVASINAASALQQELWQMQAEALSGRQRGVDWGHRLQIFDSEMRATLQTLLDRASAPNEKGIADELRSLMQQYRSSLEAYLLVPSDTPADRAQNQERLNSLVFQMSEKADKVRQINGELLRAANAHRAHISRIVLWARSIAITLVPALGILLGWWTAVRLQRTVGRIQVTLHEPTLAEPGVLGTVQVGRSGDLTSIHKQVEVVVDRLRRTGEQLQAARQEVVRAERLAAIGGLAAGVAHELRNPLTSVKLLLQHAAGRKGDAVIAAPRIELILDEIERMETTIQGLIDFSRPARPQRKLHDVRDTLQRALHLVEGRAEKQHVAMASRFGDDPVFVNGDPQQLHQVFVNLLINGIEAMPDGGRLTVALAADRPRGRFAIQFEDTGVGIPADLMPRLFEPFATAKERGTGLGLAVSRRILEEHEGTITARQRQPRGTVFEISLPAAAEAPAEFAAVV
jgi:C4-dicarboxylate-specific signal transduction histidine kinase